MSKILIDRAVVERALEALELVTDLTNHDDEIYDAIDTFCAALAEPVLNPAPGYCKHCKQYTIEEPLPAEPVQEPVAWSYELATTMLEHRYDGWEHLITRYKPNVPEGSIRNLTPLFAAPPQRKPLTREQAIALWADKSDGPSNGEIVSFARAIERAHGIKE